MSSTNTSTSTHTSTNTSTRSSHTTWARRALVLATLAIGTAYASALVMDAVPAWAPWLMAMGVPLALVSVMALGAARGGHVPASLLAAFALVGLVLAGGFAFALLPAAGGLSGAQEPLLLGLPRRAAIIVYGIGLLPVLVLPVAYALTFEAQTLREEDLERVRAVGAIAATVRERDRAARAAREAEAARVGEDTR